MLRNQFSELTTKYGDEFRNSIVIVREGFNGKNIYKGKAIATPKEILDRKVIGISSYKNITVWVIE